MSCRDLYPNGVPSPEMQRMALRDLVRGLLPEARIIAPHDSDAPRPETVGRLCVNVEIRRTSDGLSRTHVDKAGFQIGSVATYLLDADSIQDAYEAALLAAARSARYWWLEGNGGCDCNRSLFFYRAGISLGVKDEEPPVTGSVCRGRSGYELASPAWLIADEGP